MSDGLDQIKALKETYESLIRLFGEIEIENRYKKFIDSIEEYLQYFCKQHDIKREIFFVNRRMLLIAIFDFFTDVSRIKDFHQIVEVNEYKAKAYEAAWFLRRKPIQVIDDDPDSVNESVDYINEQFVFNYLLGFLIGGKDEIAKIKKSKKVNHVKGFLDSLLYYLKFRECEPRALELMLTAFMAGEVVQNIR